MWTKSAVDEAVKTYIDDKARTLHLALEIKDIETQINRIVARLPSDESGLKAQVITGMPHGTSVGNPTEQAALKLASGWEPQELKDLRQQLSQHQSEYNLLIARINHVEAWMVALNEREHWVILHQYMRNDYWRDIIDDYTRQFGQFASKDTLKRLRAKGFKKIYSVAHIKN